MRRLLAALMSISVTVAVQANPSLVGTWVSSHDLTMAFADKHAKLEERTERFLDQIMGRLTITLLIKIRCGFTKIVQTRIFGT
jgi:hypothetical protein